MAYQSTSLDDMNRVGVQVQWNLTATRPDSALPVHGRASSVTRCDMEDRRRGDRVTKEAYYTVSDAPKRISQYGFSSVDYVIIQMISPDQIGTMCYVEWLDAETLTPGRMALVPESFVIIPRPLIYSAGTGLGGIYLTNSTSAQQAVYVLTHGTN